jgi:hypothetical protein
MLCRTRGIDTISQYDFYDFLLLRFVIKKYKNKNIFVENDAKVCEFMVRNGNFEGHYAAQ